MKTKDEEAVGSVICCRHRRACGWFHGGRARPRRHFQVGSLRPRRTGEANGKDLSQSYLSRKW
jgi:hypothetical protein